MGAPLSIYILFLLGYVIGGILIGFIVKSSFSSKGSREEITELTQQLKSLRKEYEDKLINKDKELESERKKIQDDFEVSTRNTREKIEKQKNESEEKTKNLDKKADIIEKKETEIIGREKAVEDMSKKFQEKEAELNEIKQREQSVLQKISRMSPKEAREQLMKRIEEEAKDEAQESYKRIVENAKRDAQREATEIIAQAVQRNASEVTQEFTVSTVSIPDEDMKGRIIGREGRNIRALEQELNVNLIVDDTPGVITISSYDGVRREIAKKTLEILLKDGRIQPARIEEVVAKVTEEIEESVKKAGEEAAMEVGVIGVHDELIKILGKLKYRTSYGQNVLDHSISVSLLSGMMASEMELDAEFAKRAGLLHDIGKAADREMEGNHVEIGTRLAKKYGESSRLQNAIMSHHEDAEAESAEAILIEAADTISASRPGARREHLENYVKRITDIERIAKEFDGVKDAYCVSAGRELRVIVEPAKITDLDAANLAKTTAKKIEEQIEYPGEVKVTVIRSFRNTEIAR